VRVTRGTQAGFAFAGALLVAAASASAQQTQRFGTFKATTSIAYTSAESAGDASVAVAWRCMTDGLNVIYLFGNAVGREMDHLMAVRSSTDGHETHTSQWTLLEGHRAAFLPRAEVESFTTDAMASKTLVLRGTDPTSGATFRHEFRLDGLRRALQYILPCEY
jgi:hypothetical protein